jgi:hypothetical protein
MCENDESIGNQQEVTQRPAKKRTNGLLCTAWVAILIVAADFLFYRQTIGCSVTAFGLLVLGVVRLCYGRTSWNRGAATLAMALAGLLLAILEYPGILPIALFAIGVVSLALIGREDWSDEGTVWLRRWIAFFTSGWLQWLRELPAACEWGKANLNLRTPERAVRKWAFPFLLSLLFVVLFAVANPIIDRWLGQLESVVKSLWDILPYWLELPRIFLWALVGIWSVALLRLETRINGHHTVSASEITSVVRLDYPPDLIVRCLALFNVVFAVQTVLDIVYLWGGAALPQGMTYAAYAHRGAYPLVATALLAALFVLVTSRSRPSAQEMRWAYRLVYLWLAQNVFLVVSAAWRLHLYIEVYSLTRLRVAAAIWMFLVVMGLAWIGWRIVTNRTNGHLINANLLTLLAVLYLCSFLNFDGAIAAYNVRHCREATRQGPPIDFAYLLKLGPESLPALRWLAQNSDDPRAQALAPRCADGLRQELLGDLRNWRGWCLRRHRLSRDLQ